MGGRSSRQLATRWTADRLQLVVVLALRSAGEGGSCQGDPGEAWHVHLHK